LKIFSHSIRTHLTPHARPTRYIFWKWIRCKDYKVPKNRNLESVYAKKGYFFSPSPAIHACGIRWAHPSRPRSVKKFPFPAVETSPARRSPLQQRVRLVRGGLRIGVEIQQRAHSHDHHEAGLDLPLVTGRFTAVTSLTGLDRLRYRPVTNR
jgi:hypothetical protein